MTTALRFLRANTPFTVPSLGVRWTLLSVNESRARVRIGDEERKTVRFTDRWGNDHEFVRRQVRETSWNPNVEVEVE